MGISILSSTAQVGTYITPRIKPTAKELAELKKEPTKVATEGNIYTSTAIHFKELSLEELKYEKISVDKSKFTYVSYSDGTKNEPNRLVVMHDPENNNKFVTIQLSKKSIDQLKQKFDGTNNFFERSDGTLRLNGDVEAFVAGWMQNIKMDRNYSKSDADGNGLIEGDEAKTLTIGYARQTNYDYIGKKLVKINLSVGEKYQDMEHVAAPLFMDKNEKLQFQTKRSATNANYIQFENSVEKELDHTIQMDIDLNGTVTLKEGLTDEFGKDYRKKVISDTEKFHTDLLYDHPNLNDDSQLQNYDFGQAEAKKEKEATLQQMDQDALKISTFDLLNFTNQKDKTISDTLKQLQIQTVKSSYFGKQDETANIEKISG